MLSRIIAILISVALFLSSFYFVVFAEPQLFSFEKENGEALAVGTDEPTLILSFKDLSYGDHERQRLDLSVPKGPVREVGLLLYIHGGGWTSGDKTSLGQMETLLSDNSQYATASMNYRYVTSNSYNAYDIIDDITAALSCIKETAEKNGIRITKVVLSGHSAGAHLSLLYAYRYYAVSPIEIVGVFALSAVSDFNNDDFYTENSRGDEADVCKMMSKVTGQEITVKNRKDKFEILSELSPIDYVNEKTVHTVILHGKNDKVAPFKGSEKLVEKLSAYHIDHDFIIFNNSGHNLKDPDTFKTAEEIMKERLETFFLIN